MNKLEFCSTAELSMALLINTNQRVPNQIKVCDSVQKLIRNLENVPELIVCDDSTSEAQIFASVTTFSIFLCAISGCLAHAASGDIVKYDELYHF